MNSVNYICYIYTHKKITLDEKNNIKYEYLETKYSEQFMWDEQVQKSILDLSGT